MIRTVASLAGITAAFLLVLYLTYNDDGGDSISSTPAPSRAAAASPSQTGQPQDSAADAVLTRGEPVEFPEDVALIVGQTCQRCDEGEYSAILRVNRDEEDGIWVDQLFPPLGLGDHKVTSVAVSFGKMIAVTSCPANCVQMPSGEQTLYVSTDGGVTWVEWERVGGDAFVAMVRHVSASEGIEFDQVVVGYPPTTSGGDYAFTAYPPSLAPYHTSIPSEAFQGVVPGVGPVWLRPHDEFIPMNQLMTLDDWSYRSFDDSVNWRLLSVAYFRNEDVKAFERTVDTKDEVEYVLEIGDASHIWPSRIRALRSIGQSRLLGDAEIDPAEVGVDGSDLLNLPVIIDDFRGTVSPIAEPFLSPRFLEHRYDVLMVQNGKFARVLGTDGCLEIRATPDPESDVVECVPERALLMRGSRAFESRGETWLAVGTPAGGSGYALTEHLEY